MNIEKLNVSKITCEIFKTLAPTLAEVLQKIGIKKTHIHSRRSLLLHEKSLLSFLPPTTSLDEDPAEVFEFYVVREISEMVVKIIVKELQLSMPGRGSIYVESVEIINPKDFNFINLDLSTHKEEKSDHSLLLKKLSCISCVVQRGRGNEIARHALEAGTNVPSISFCVGTGLRNKLGLIRVTIPAEKEMVSVVINDQDKDEIMNFLVEAGRLDRPGNGFIGITPVEFGLLNTKTFRGKQRHSASMEQVISAIDQIKTGTDWRKKTTTINHKSGKYLQKSFLKDMINMTIVCNEGKSDALISAALKAGAGGATIGKVKHTSLETVASDQHISHAREAISMGVASNCVSSILDSIQEIGAFEAEISSVVELKSLPLACTYLGKK